MRMNKKTLLLLTAMVMLFVVSPALAAEEAAAGPLDKLGINNGFLIAQTVNFGLIFLLLYVALWPRMAKMMDERKEKIEKGLEDAAKAADARRNAEAEAEKILAQARTEAQQVVAQASERGEEVAKGIETEARAEADKIREDARLAAQGERDQQLAGLRNDVINISVAIAEKLIGSVDSKKQKEVVSDFLSNVPAGAAELSGNVTVVSAMPLEKAEQDKVKKALSKAGEITYKVDPAILGGLIIRAGDQVIDGSVRSNLNNLSEDLK